MAGKGFDATQVAQASTPESSGPDWGNLFNKAKHAASNVADAAVSAGHKVMNSEAVHTAEQKAKNLDGRKIGNAAESGVLHGGPHGAVLGAGLEVVRQTTGVKIPNPLEMKGQIVEGAIRGATGHDVHIPTTADIKGQIVHGAVDGALRKNHPAASGEMAEKSMANPFAHRASDATTSSGDEASPVQKAQAFGSQLLHGIGSTAHKYLPQTTIDGSDTKSKK